MISVIMPVYNRAEFLSAAIESILKQTETDLELIIVNDGSTDNSEEVILSFTDDRIRYFKQSNQGVSAAINLGLDQVRGDFIALQDSDDISVPCRLAVLKRNFIADNIGLVHSDVLLINEHNEPIGYYQNRNVDKSSVRRYFLKVGSPICGSSIMVRKQVFEHLRYDTNLWIGEDNDVLLQIAEKWHTIHVAEPLYFYRLHGGNTARKGASYQETYAHIHKILHKYSTKELIPEANWQDNETDAEARASAIIALYLFRRGMSYDANNWLQTAKELPIEYLDTMKFIAAVYNIIVKNYQGALEYLASIEKSDHLVENYLGECYGLAGNIAVAKHHFLNALNLCPNYAEPLENLKALAGLTGYTLDDNSLAKFKETHG